MGTVLLDLTQILRVVDGSRTVATSLGVVWERGGIFQRRMDPSALTLTRC